MEAERESHSGQTRASTPSWVATLSEEASAGRHKRRRKQHEMEGSRTRSAPDESLSDWRIHADESGGIENRPQTTLCAGDTSASAPRPSSAIDDSGTRVCSEKGKENQLGMCDQRMLCLAENLPVALKHLDEIVSLLREISSKLSGPFNSLRTLPATQRGAVATEVEGNIQLVSSWAKNVMECNSICGYRSIMLLKWMHLTSLVSRHRRI